MNRQVRGNLRVSRFISGVDMVAPILTLFIYVITSALLAEPFITTTISETSKMQKQYRDLQDDWQKKRAFCLDLIDKGVIRRGVDQKSVLEIFDRDVFIVARRGGSKFSADILFEKQNASFLDGNETKQHAPKGWYLFVESDLAGKISNYYLSNLHK